MANVKVTVEELGEVRTFECDLFLGAAVVLLPDGGQDVKYVRSSPERNPPWRRELSDGLVAGCLEFMAGAAEDMKDLPGPKLLGFLAKIGVRMAGTVRRVEKAVEAKNSQP